MNRKIIYTCLFSIFLIIKNINASECLSEDEMESNNSNINIKKEDVDVIRIDNIIYLLENSHQMHPLFFLRNISWQVDGMSVLKRSFRDRTANIVPIWSSLAYLHRALPLEQSNMQFLTSFIKKIHPLLCLAPKFLQELRELECQKLSIRQFMEELPENLFKSLKIEEGGEDKKDGEDKDENNIILSNLDNIKKCTLFTDEYKFQRSMEIVEEYIKQTTGDLTNVNIGRKEVEIKERDLQDRIKELNKLGPYQQIQRLIGIFYEYESLKEAQSSLSELETINSNDVDEYLLLRTITLLGEALNNISTPIDLDGSQDVLKFVPSIKYLRNVLEHPTNHQKNKFTQLLNNPLSKQILYGLCQDLLKVKNLLENRLGCLHQVINSEDNCDELLGNILAGGTPKKEESGIQPTSVPKKWFDLLKQAQWQNNDLTYIQWMRRYLYHPKYPLGDPESENLISLARDIVKNEYLISKPSERTTDISEIIHDINNIKQSIQHYNKHDLFRELNDRKSLYAHLTNFVTQVFLKINTMIESHDLSFYNRLTKNEKKLFEVIFSELRDQRNFYIHDFFWRKDLRGLVKISYLLVYNLQPILLISQPTILNEATKEMWRNIYFNPTLDVPTLKDLISRGADVNASLDADILKELITEEEGGSDSLSSTHSPLSYIINQTFDEDLVKELLDSKACPNQCNNQGQYPLHVAAQDNKIGFISLLCDEGAIPDLKDIDGCTPEDYALGEEHEDAAMLLRGMEAKFKGDEADKLHRNLSYFTFDQSHIDPIYGCCTNLMNADGELPLVLAIKKSESEDEGSVLRVVEYLVRAGAEVTKRQRGGKTPLISAAYNSNDKKLLTYLLDNGASVNKSDKDDDGYSALDYATQLAKDDFIGLLSASPDVGPLGGVS
jgi:ankyrin repeat protein